MHVMPDRVRRYVRRIRNAQKRSYADAYARYLLGERDEPTRVIVQSEAGLSYMAAQAVRLELHDMLDTQ
jgi:hypothetical protein